MKIIKTILNSICFLLLSALIVFVTFINCYGITFANADTVSASNVLDDLHKDETFIESNYPEIAEDYSIQLIQIAESMDGELLVYVYQPSGQAKDLKAVSINISTSAVEEIDPDNFKLKFCNSSGVFYKYVVDGLTVSEDNTRYYAIPSIFRAFIDEVDPPADNENIITETPYPVQKQYCFSEINGNPYCKVIDFQTIEITEKFVGFVRYSDGYNFWGNEWPSCDSHFVAFNTDKPIDKLLEAKVYYTKQSFKNGKSTNYVKTFGSVVDEDVKLRYSEKVEHTGDYFGAGTYTWNRIETVEQFIAENDITQNVYSGALINVDVANKITDEGITALKGKQWLLRFVETEYTFTTSGSAASGNFSTETTSTLVGEVTILSLKFETDGITYNLGVIDNKQTGSNKPINKEETTIDFTPLTDILKIIALILFFIAIVFVFPPIVKIFKFLFKAVVFVICMPFKLIASIFKRR